MQVFPFEQPQHSKALMKTACQLYRRSVLAALPFALFMVGIVYFMRFGNHFFNAKWAMLYPKLSMLAAILLLPLSGAIFTVMDHIGKQQPYTFFGVMRFCAQRFISLIGCAIYVIFIPALVAGVCIIIYIVMGVKHVPGVGLMIWIAVTELLIFASFIPNIFAPILIFSDKLDANPAVDYSHKLVKGFFVRTFIYGLYAVLIIILLGKFASLVHFYFPHLSAKIPHSVLEGISAGLLVIIGPWSYALLLTHKYDLQTRVPLTGNVPKPPTWSAKKAEKQVSF